MRWYDGTRVEWLFVPFVAVIMSIFAASGGTFLYALIHISTIIAIVCMAMAMTICFAHWGFWHGLVRYVVGILACSFVAATEIVAGANVLPVVVVCLIVGCIVTPMLMHVED